MVLTSLKTNGRQLDNFVATGGTVSCHKDKLRYHERWQNCEIDDILFPVFGSVIYADMLQIKFISTFYEIVFKWMPQDLSSD